MNMEGKSFTVLGCTPKIGGFPFLWNQNAKYFFVCYLFLDMTQLLVPCSCNVVLCTVITTTV
jgi:hypothetical protein